MPVLLLLALLCCVPAIAQDQGESALLLASGGGGATISYAGAACVGNASAASGSCTMGASGAIGDLLIVISKTSATSSTPTAAMTFSGTASCVSPTQVIAPIWQSNGTGGHFIAAMFGCIITTAGARSPVVTWVGADGTFTDIAVATYHTSTSWKSTFVDRTATNIAATSSTSCPTGTTAATTNAADLIVAVCMNFNVAETWGSLAGFTNRASSSRNTSGWYDKSVSATGTQTATVPLSAADFGLGMIAAFASN